MCFTGQYGVPRPWYFIFQLNYWGGVPLEVGLPIPTAPTEEQDGKTISDRTFGMQTFSVFVLGQNIWINALGC